MKVSDATPLINFARIDALALLRDVAGELVIPAAVAAEIRAYSPVSPGGIDLDAQDWISVQQVKPILVFRHLGAGEASVLDLACQYRERVELVLMDERRGRRLGQELDLPILGSAGVLLQAKRMGLIDLVEPIFDRMEAAGAHLGSRLRQSVLKAAEEAR